MKVGVYASLMASERGHERNVSAHIQVPLHTAFLLEAAGHEVHIITNRFGPQHVLPAALPRDASVHLVEDGRRRPKQLRGGTAQSGFRPVAMVRQLHQIKRVARRERLDVLHVFGLARSAALAGALKHLGVSAPVAATLVTGNVAARTGRVARSLLRSVDAVITATDYAAGELSRLGVNPHVVRHGVIRDLVAELGATPTEPRRRVLFWREPDEMSGADLCVTAFDELAPAYPGFSFDFAIRPTRIEVPGIDELAARHENVHVYRFPYELGISLPRLIAESILIVLPFRRLTVDPQLTIAESLAAGVPTVVSDIRSNPELVEPDVTGAIVPAGEVRPLVDTLRRLLSDQTTLATMREQTATRFRARWNWDDYTPALEAIYVEIAS